MFDAFRNGPYWIIRLTKRKEFDTLLSLPGFVLLMEVYSEGSFKWGEVICDVKAGEDVPVLKKKLSKLLKKCN